MNVSYLIICLLDWYIDSIRKSLRKNWSLLEIKQLQAYPVKKYLQTREYGSREVCLEEDLVS